MLERLHSSLGLLLLGGFLVHHQQRLGAVLGGPAAWLEAEPDAGARVEVGAVVLAGVLIHGALGFVRIRRRRGAEPGPLGLARLQLVTGALAGGFVVYHLMQVWAHVTFGLDQPAHTAAYDGYAALWRQLGQPLPLAAYLVGVSATCFHLGHGLARLPGTWGLGAPLQSARVQLFGRLLGGVVGFAIWVGFLQSLGHFAIGEPLLPLGAAQQALPGAGSLEGDATSPDG